MSSLMSLRLPLLTMLLVSAPNLVLASDEEESGGRDLVSGDTAFGQEAGELELEFEAKYVDASDADEWELRLGLEYGLTDRVQLAAELPYEFVDPRDEEEASRSGLGLAAVGVQVALLGEEAPVALSLAMEVATPLGDSGEDESTEISASVLMARVFRANEVFGGVQATWLDEGREYEYELGFVHSFGRWATEIQVTYTDGVDEGVWEVQPGLVIEDLGPFDLGFDVSRSFADEGDEWGFGITLTAGLD